MLRKVSKVVVISVVASFVITGCAIKPDAILKEDVKQMVQKDLTVLSEVVQPVTKARS